jgi:hypothetical protein
VAAGTNRLAVVEMKVRLGNPVAIEDRLPDRSGPKRMLWKPPSWNVGSAIPARDAASARTCSALEAVAEENADLPAAVYGARFVQEVASGKIQAGNSKIRVIEGIQEFAA